MDIMAMAAAVGLRVKVSPEGLRYEKAKREYEACKEINEALMEYQVQQQVMESQKEAENFDAQLVENVEERLDALYKQITEHPLFKEYEAAQAELNDLLKKVNQTIITQITGEKSSSCSGNCSGCAGCKG